MPPALARLLETAGHQAEHVEDVGLRDEGDHRIWDFAVEHQAILITKDEDFAARLLRDGSGPVVIWLRIGNCTHRALLQWFEPLLPSILNSVRDENRLIEVR